MQVSAKRWQSECYIVFPSVFKIKTYKLHTQPETNIVIQIWGKENKMFGFFN